MSCSPTDTDTSKLKAWKVPLRRGDDYDIDIDDESPDLRGSAERYSRSKRFVFFFPNNHYELGSILPVSGNPRHQWTCQGIPRWH